MLRTYSAKEWATAFHEAGHAVVAVCFNLEILAVTVRESADCYGASFQPLILTDDIEGLQAIVRKHIVVAYAGYAAEKLFGRGSVSYWNSYDDDEGARNLADEFLSAPHRLESLRDEAKRIVAREWRAIAALANALLERGTLLGNDVETVVKPILKIGD